MAFKKNPIADLIAQAAKLEDHSVRKATADFERRLIPKGRTVGRFIEFIELGVQKRKAYMGKAKKPVEQVRVTFELLGAKNAFTLGEGKDAKTIYDRISVTMTKSFHKKASLAKLFDKMAQGRDDIKHIGQMLGEGFILDVQHNPSESDPKVIYANLTDADGAWQVSAPVVPELDDEGNEIGQKRIKVPEATLPIRAFIWDMPTEESWNSLFIDGQRESEDEKGKKKVESKNWLQELILRAENFSGSPLEQMLEGSDQIPNLTESEEEEAELEELEEEEEVVPVKKSTSAASTAKSAVKPSKQSVTPAATAPKSAGKTPALKKATTSAPVTKGKAVKATAPVKGKASKKDALADLGLLED